MVWGAGWWQGIAEFTSTDVKDSKITGVWGGTTCLPEQWKTGHSALGRFGKLPTKPNYWSPMSRLLRNTLINVS